MERHEAFVARAAEGDINVLFLGDSITDFWRRPDAGAAVWEREFAPLGAANFGISGDRTQHVLWRLEHGEADGYQPQVVVLLIGTNNTGFERDSETPRNSTNEVIEGVTAVVEKVREKSPAARILLHALFPRGTRDDPQRYQVREINRALASLHDGEHVVLFDIGDRFLDAGGEIRRELMPDLLHPSRQGYEVWADALRAPLRELLERP
jgi:lysophospholipase L1-like esterase